MPRAANRFSIYDVMEAKGVFANNPANADSPEYKAPIKYPMMFYHPEGERRVMVPPEQVLTPFGPKEYGEQLELISRVVSNPAEERALRAEGWHDHPAKAEVAGGRPGAPMSPSGRIADLEAEIARLQAEKGLAASNQDELESLADRG